MKQLTGHTGTINIQVDVLFSGDFEFQLAEVLSAQKRKHRENRKILPREHLIGCQGVKMFLLNDPFSSSFFQSIGPLGRCFHRVAMCVCLFVCLSDVPLSCDFFRGLSLVLRSHDQFKASNWSTLLQYHKKNKNKNDPSPPPFLLFFSVKAPWRRQRQWRQGGINKESLKASWQLCYYPHRSRDALSPVCWIFFLDTCWTNFSLPLFNKLKLHIVIPFEPMMLF